MTASDLTDLDLTAARDGLVAKEFSAVELTKAYLGAIEAAKPLNAYLIATPDQALAAAAQSDTRIAQGRARPKPHRTWRGMMVCAMANAPQAAI